MRFVTLREIADDPVLRRDWNALVERVEMPQVFYTYEWAMAVQRSYAKTLLPLVFLQYDEQEGLIGVAALATNALGDAASFLCATTADYCDFLSQPECREGFVQAVLGELGKLGIGKVVLANLPADSATISSIKRVSGQSRYFCFARTGYICAQVSLAAIEKGDKEKPALPRKKMLRRFVNAMGKDSPVWLDHARSRQSIEALLPEFMQAHVARFLTTGRISNMARPERRAFLTELSKLLAESGWVTLTRMMTGPKAVAWNYGFQFRGTWFWYQPTFDSDLEKYSPGACLLAKLIEEAAEDPTFETVDLGLGAEGYKERFANHARETLHVSLNKSRPKHFREIVRYGAAAAVKTFPTVEMALRVAVRNLQEVKQQVFDRGVGQGALELGARVRGFFWTEKKITLWEWGEGPLLSRPGDMELQAVNLNRLAIGVAQYSDDPATLDYLLRSARRLRSKNAEGLVLTDADGRPCHFLWIADFESCCFQEPKVKADLSVEKAAVVYGRWTPTCLRGHGYEKVAAQLLAAHTQERGKHLWMFTDDSVASADREMQESGFVQRHSFVRKRLLWWNLVSAPGEQTTVVSNAEASFRS